MKYENKDLLKIEKWLTAILDQFGSREKNKPRFKKEDSEKMIKQIDEARLALRCIARGLN